MKNKYSTLIILVLFIVFSLYQYYCGKEYKVLNVVTPTILEIDTNGNNIVDDNERFCLPNIKTFTANLKYNSNELMPELGLSYSQSIALGYLADEYANSVLRSDKIILEISDEKHSDCRPAKIIVGNDNYEDILLNNGYAIKDGKPANEQAFNQVLDRANKLDLVLLNHHSQKYHTLDCKYGKVAEDAIVLLKKEVPQNAKPCQFCIVQHPRKVNKNNTKKASEQPQIPPPPNIAYDGNIKLILTDFTSMLKPNSNCSHEVCRDLVKAINSATETIDIAMYGIEDVPAVIDALEGAKNRGISIRVVYDTDQKFDNYYNGTLKFVERFTDAVSDKINGNAAQTNMLMHNKFVIIDRKKVFTGSMNFSVTGLSGFNHNNVVIINSERIANLYSKEFEQMYKGKFHLLKDKTQNNMNIQEGPSLISVYFSPQDKGLSTAVAGLIKNSKNYIYVPTFVITHKKLTEELIAAKARGVDVKIIIDATSTHSLHSEYKEIQKSGIPIKVENFAGKMHAKTMIIDDEYLVLGSTNFSNSGENKNDENLIVLKNQKFAKLYKDYFLYFWKKIPDKYLRYGARPEGPESIGSCSDGIDNNFDGQVDKGDNGCK